MKRLYLTFFSGLIILGSFGLSIAFFQQTQDIRSRASELPFKTSSSSIQVTPTPQTVAMKEYASQLYNYKILFDPTYWSGEYSSTKDAKTITYSLNQPYGKAEVSINAFTLPNSKTSFNTEIEDTIYQKAIAYLKSDPQLRVTEIAKIQRNGAQVMQVTIAKQIMKSTVVSYAYIVINNAAYYIITSAAIPGTSTDRTEAFINTFIATNAYKDIKGDVAVQNFDTPMDDAKVAAVTSPSVVNIVNFYCSQVHANIPPMISSDSAHPETPFSSIQFFSKTYTYCDAGEGSGFIISGDGLIATNGHVAKIFPLEGLTNAFLSGSSPELDKFITDYYREEISRISGKPISMNQAIHEASPNTMKTDTAVWLFQSLKRDINNKKISVDNGKSNYFIKLGYDPLPINMKNAGKLLATMNSFKETANIKAASLVDFNYDDKYVMDISNTKSSDISGPDVAIVKINNPGHLTFPGIELGDYTNLKEGANLLVIGYPGIAQGEATTSSLLSFQSNGTPTVTRGIVSALKKDQTGGQLIQTDASIAEGNSGGPGIDDTGKVVGIATYTLEGRGSGNYNFLRSITELQELLKKNDITIEDNRATDYWYAGLNNYWNGYYRKALLDFNEVKKLYPIHPTVNNYITESKTAIREGRDKDGLWGTLTELIPARTLAILSLTILLAGIAGLIIYLYKHRHKKSQNQPPKPVLPQALNTTAVIH